jgi:hypothetical protein
MLVRGPNVVIVREDVPCFVCQQKHGEFFVSKYLRCHKGLYIPVCEDHADSIPDNEHPQIRLILREVREQERIIGKAG